MVGSQHFPQLSVLSAKKELQGIIAASLGFHNFMPVFIPEGCSLQLVGVESSLFSSSGVLTDPWSQLLKPQCDAAFSV